MKTSVTMFRKMGSFTVKQRTKDGMFNATSLLKQWNKSNKSKKEIASFFKMKQTKEFIKTLENDDMAISPYHKSRANKGINAGTWMHPYLFIDFAMWINPKFKLSVIKFVYDELIKNRNLAGDKYVQLSASGSKLKGYDYREIAIAIQHIVFNKTGKGLRQVASEKELQEINEIQNRLSIAIDFGYIKTYNQLILELRKMYRVKYSKKLKISV